MYCIMQEPNFFQASNQICHADMAINGNKIYDSCKKLWTQAEWSTCTYSPTWVQTSVNLKIKWKSMHWGTRDQHFCMKFNVLDTVMKHSPLITALFNNMWNLKFISLPTVAFFAAVNHHLNICTLAINGSWKNRNLQLTKWIEIHQSQRRMWPFDPVSTNREK